MLIGKTVLIAGATGGIGAPIARELRRLGANLVLFARKWDKLTALTSELGNEEVIAISGDACDPKAVRLALDRTESEFGRLDAVVITVGTWRRLGVQDSIEEAADNAEHLHRAIYLPTVVMAHAALSSMLKQPNGSVIFHMSSHVTTKPHLKGNLSYRASKAASEAYLEGMRNEIGNSHVQIVDIRPAIVNTPENAPLLDTEKKQRMAVQPEEIGLWIAQSIGKRDLPAWKAFESDLILD